MCPTHHHIAHVLYNDEVDNISLTKHESDRYRDMLGLIDPQIYEGKPYEEYYEKLVARVVDRVEEGTIEYCEEMVEYAQIG